MDRAGYVVTIPKGEAVAFRIGSIGFKMNMLEKMEFRYKNKSGDEKVVSGRLENITIEKMVPTQSDELEVYLTGDVILDE